MVNIMPKTPTRSKGSLQNMWDIDETMESQAPANNKSWVYAIPISTNGNSFLQEGLNFLASDENGIVRCKRVDLAWGTLMKVGRSMTHAYILRIRCPSNTTLTESGDLALTSLESILKGALDKPFSYEILAEFHSAERNFSHDGADEWVPINLQATIQRDWTSTEHKTVQDRPYDMFLMVLYSFAGAVTSGGPTCWSRVHYLEEKRPRF